MTIYCTAANGFVLLLRVGAAVWSSGQWSGAGKEHRRTQSCQQTDPAQSGSSGRSFWILILFFESVSICSYIFFSFFSRTKRENNHLFRFVFFCFVFNACFYFNFSIKKIRFYTNLQNSKILCRLFLNLQYWDFPKFVFGNLHKESGIYKDDCFNLSYIEWHYGSWMNLNFNLLKF